MKRAILAGVSAVALTLGGCSMFHSSSPSTEGNAGATAQPAYSGSSQPSQQAAPSSSASMEAASPAASEPSSHMSASANPSELRQAQQKLKDDGDYHGQIDGKFGPKTRQALKDFQQKNGLPQTGQLDQQTASKLGLNSTEGSGSSMPPANPSSQQ